MIEKYQVDRPIILIVEDHDALRASLRRLLEASIPAVSILEDANLPDALDTIADTAIDVLLVDFRPPGMHGIDGIREIRRRAPAITIVICSSLNGSAQYTAARAAGAFAVVAKSRVAEDLVPLLCDILSSRHGTGGANTGDGK